MFEPSVTPDITESLPLPLSARVAANIAAYSRSGAAFDVAIGGLPFFLKIDAQHTYQRATAQWKKDQFDNSREPGEQSLQQWWTRSQSSFHKGEGIGFYEPATDELTADRYAHAVGVDVWTPGQLTLLRSMAEVESATSGDVWVESATINGTSGFYSVFDGDVHYTIDGSAPVTVTNSGADAVSRPAMCGSDVVVGTAAGGLLKGSIGAATIAAFTSGLPADTVPATPYWVKSRIIATVGNKLYEVPLAGGTSLTPLYSHPDTSWVWSYVAESPQAILAAGFSPSGRSAIFRFNLTTPADGSTPELGQPSQVAEFPPGESVHAIRVYLGTYIGIGTSLGLRVGVVSEDGSIQYGPLLVRTNTPVQSITGFDEFIVAGVTNAIDGGSGGVRVNLAEPVEDLRFAWAWDVQTGGTGTVQSIAFMSTTRGGVQQTDVVLGVEDVGVYRQSGVFVESGFVLSGKVRYGTTEPKLFRLLDVDCVTAGGSVALSTVDAHGSEAFLFTLDDQTGIVGGLNVDSMSTPQKYAQVRLTLRPSGDASKSPLIRSWTVKSLPVVPRQRLIQYPLVCADFHTDVNGIKVGSKGGAANALFALEAAESTSALLLVQDFRTGETFPASIESVSLEGSDPPTRHDPAFRGTLTVTCRKV